MPVCKHGIDERFCSLCSRAKTTSPNASVVWRRIEAHQGDDFATKTGKPFTYTIRNGAVRPSRTDWQISRGDFEKALERVPLKNTTEVHDLQGPSFIYAILMDERIRAEDW